jgi:hypothetical protein
MRLPAVEERPTGALEARVLGYGRRTRIIYEDNGILAINFEPVTVASTAQVGVLHT